MEEEENGKMAVESFDCFICCCGRPNGKEKLCTLHQQSAVAYCCSRKIYMSVLCVLNVVVGISVVRQRKPMILIVQIVFPLFFQQPIYILLSNLLFAIRIISFSLNIRLEGT